MSIDLITLVLLAAMLHAVWNALAKSGGSPLYSIAANNLIGGVICLCLIWLAPFPPLEAWPFLIASVIIHTAYYFTLSKAYQSGDLSLVYPIFRGTAPLLVAGGAAWFHGEFISSGALVGVMLISAGLLSLALFGGHRIMASLPSLGWALVTSVLIAAYTVTDGVGVRAVESSLSYIFWLFMLESIPLALWLLATERRSWLHFMNENRTHVLAGGVAATAAYGIVIHAMGLGPMALVSSLRETSVIFAAVIGALLLHEPFGRRRIFAAALVALGVMVIRYLADT